MMRRCARHVRELCWCLWLTTKLERWGLLELVPPRMVYDRVATHRVLYSDLVGDCQSLGLAHGGQGFDGSGAVGGGSGPAGGGIGWSGSGWWREVGDY